MPRRSNLTMEDEMKTQIKIEDKQVNESMTEWTLPNQFNECFRVYQGWSYKKIIKQMFGDRILRVGRDTLLGREWASNLKTIESATK
jgi:hypothetical protein